MWLRLVVTLILAMLYVVVIYYYMSMFQQNSYKASRFWTWFRKSPLPRFVRSAKVKFVFTPRMRRLAAAEAGLFILLSVASVYGAVACVVLSPFVMLLCDILLKPVEKHITMGFYKDAKRILASRNDLIIIGVTGSYGKTSTKNYLYRILSEKYNVLMTPGNFNTTLGVVRTIREHLEPYHQVFIVEMGAKQTGDIKEICDLVHPTIGIITAVGEMHLETFGSFENIQRTKFELARALPSDGLAVLNMDSPGVSSYVDKAGLQCKTVLYGIDAHRADCRAANIVYSPSGMEFDFISRSGSGHYRTHVLGECNVLNLCAALMVAEYLGVNPSQRAVSVYKIQPVEHRLSMRRSGGVTVLDDAYNSNPEGAAMALGVLRSMSLPQGAFKIVITPGFVEMGSAQYAWCHRLGELAAKSCDFLVVVNRTNREAIVSGARDAGMPESCIVCADTLAQAHVMISPMFTAGSVVLYENDLPDTFK